MCVYKCNNSSISATYENITSLNMYTYKCGNSATYENIWWQTWKIFPFPIVRGIFIVSECLHWEKWIWEDILSRESGGQMKFETKWGNKAKFKKHHIFASPQKSKQIVICKFYQTAAVWHNMCIWYIIHHTVQYFNYALTFLVWFSIWSWLP